MTSRGPQFKCVLLGEVNVGKTSLFFRIKDDTFTDSSRKTTLGIDSCSRIVHIDKTTHVKLCVWDTAGVERFRTLTRSYYRSTQVSFLIYSVDNPTSLHYLPKWIEDATDLSPTSIKVLIGNKSDLNPEIKPSTIENFASIHNIDLSFTVSAKTGAGIEEMLEKIARSLIQQTKLGNSDAFKMKEDTVRPSGKDLKKPNCNGCSCST